MATQKIFITKFKNNSEKVLTNKIECAIISIVKDNTKQLLNEILKWLN